MLDQPLDEKTLWLMPASILNLKVILKDTRENKDPDTVTLTKHAIAINALQIIFKLMDLLLAYNESTTLSFSLKWLKSMACRRIHVNT